MSQPFGPGELKQIARQVSADIDAWCEANYFDGFRWHLGASLIGGECWRAIWYGFRWCFVATYVNAQGVSHKGRMGRLFNRGHLEEQRFVEWLRGIGFTVEEFDISSKLYYNPPTGTYSLEESYDQPDAIWVDVSDSSQHVAAAKKKGVERKQFRISDVNGHFGGSTDGKVWFHARYGNMPPMLCEFKTSGEKAFEKLKKDGVKIAKPTHFAQMCSYGRRFGLQYCLYMAINKNNDEIHLEIVELDFAHADHNTQKAARIINSPTPPPKISQNSAYITCKQCDYAPICHGRGPYEKNCRSCTFAQPVENGEWFCHKFQNIIPRDFIPKGCDQHVEAR